MIIHPAPQNSVEWQQARVGLLTASCMDQVIQPRKMEPSRSQGKLLTRLLAEWATGAPLDGGSSSFMERGHTEEEAAVKWYSFAKGDVRRVGLCLRDDGRVGASPDGLVGDDGLVEVKTLAADNHVSALLGERNDDHRAQVQAQLWVCERSWCDLLFWNPILPPVVVRIERDEPFIAALSEAVDHFLARLEEGRARLVALGCVPPEPDADDLPPEDDLTPPPAPLPIVPLPALPCLTHADQTCPDECSGRLSF